MRTGHDISYILSSHARFKVLEVFYLFRAPLRIRELEGFSHVAIGSVQAALQGLLKQGVVTRFQKARQKDRKILYKLNPQHYSYKILADVFALVGRHAIRERAQEYQATAKQTLQFADELRKLINAVKVS